MTDSAGVPWAGRHFEPNHSAGDDGSAPAGITSALAEFRAGRAGEATVVDAIRESRLLIPLVATLEASGVADSGLMVDKSAELGIVTVAGPDGRTVLPAFSSVEAMRRWNASARPVPADAVRVALAAVSEGTDLVVLDPGSDTEFVLRRPAVWAVAQAKPWTPSYLDPAVRTELLESARSEPSVVSVRLEAGDPHGRLAGPELVVVIGLAAGLARVELEATVQRMQRRWAQSAILAERVDSMAVRLVAAPVS